MGVLVREHRGLLTESMETVREVKDRQELLELIRDQLAPFSLDVKVDQLQVKPYIFDSRIGWDTHLITIDGYGVWGMSDGPL
jgi:hypothetical protein